MAQVSPKKTHLPAFIEIYSPEPTGRSKSFTSGGNGAFAGGYPTVGLNGGNNGSFSPGGKQPPKQRTSNGDISISTEDGFMPSSNAALRLLTNGAAGFPTEAWSPGKDSSPSTTSAPTAAVAAPAVLSSPKASSTAATALTYGAKSQGRAKRPTGKARSVADVTKPLMNRGGSRGDGDSGSGSGDGSDSALDRAAQGECRQAGEDAEGAGVPARAARSLGDAIGMAVAVRPKASSPFSAAAGLAAAEGELPRLGGVRFDNSQQQPQASASPLMRRGSETAASRSTSFSGPSGSNGSATGPAAALRGASFTSGRAPGTANLYRVKWLDFGHTPEQALLKRTAEKVARTALAKHAAKADDTRTFPREAVAAAGKEGFGGVAVPQAAGGLGLCANDSALIFEALGMGDTSVAGYLTLHNMVAWLVAHHATPTMQQQILRNLASTALLAAYAASEPSSGSDPAAVSTSATPGAGGGYVLNGSKALVAGASVADVFLVLARTDELPTKGLSLFLVNRTAAGVSVGRPERSLGWRCVSLASLTLQNCIVRGDALVGREGQGLELLNAALDLQRVWLSAVSVGGAQLALDYAISHGKGRKQGTKTITDMQAVQFRLVDLHTELQAARLMVRSAAQQLDAKAPSRTLASCMAKQFATETAATVAAEACSLMGGAGMVGDHPPERIARDLRAHTVVGGSNEQLVGRVYSEMQRQPSLFTP